LMNNPEQSISCNHCFGSVFIWTGSGSIQHFKLNNDPDSDQDPVRIRIQSEFIVLMTKNYKNGILPIPRPPYRRSLQPSKENIRHFKTWNCLIFSCFCESFLLSCILIPDPDSGSGLQIRIWILWPDWIWIQSQSWSRIRNTACDTNIKQNF
jgi:hypothetical protein